MTMARLAAAPSFWDWRPPSQAILSSVHSGKPVFAVASGLSTALFADGFDLRRRNVQEFQELLVFFRGGAFEFGVPAVHLFFRETARTHDGNPLFLRNHVCLSQRPRAQQFQNGVLVGPQRFDFGV